MQGYIGSPYTECRPECYGDRDCPAGRPACFYGICKNTCDGACGAGADCNLRGLTPVCSCPRDMTGDPFISCRPFTKGSLSSSTILSSDNFIFSLKQKIFALLIHAARMPNAIRDTTTLTKNVRCVRACPDTLEIR